MSTNEYDYIICGAGSAGCVLANKLSDDPSLTVLLLEAGPMDRNLSIRVPARVASVYRNPGLNWNYQSEPEPHLNGRRIFTPRGRVVGGSSSINAMVYMRGHPLDYDRWALDFDLPDWRYADCLPYFKAAETSDRGGDDWRGGSGPLSVTKGAMKNPLFDAFLAAGETSGQGVSEDLNGYRPEGLSRFDATKGNGQRCSAATAYLRPALMRPNLTLVTGAQVRRLLVAQGRATGVEYRHRGKWHSVRANREVILAGGAINSPQVLMLSGIGPADHLRSHGIKVLHDLPGVGQNLQDHATIVMQVACKQPVTLDWLNRPHRKAAAGLEWLLRRTGAAASNIWEAGGLVRGNRDVAYPNLQYHFAPVGYTEDARGIRLEQAFSMHVDQLRPTSRGQVTLKSADPFASPAMRFNYLQTEHDRRELIEGIKLARDLFRQQAFDPFRGAELLPGDAVQTDADILGFLSQSVGTDYHPCGTCRMGADAEGVVDGSCRVHGVDGLRVVDASVMPQVISANLNAPVQMIAARAADHILGRPQRTPETVRFHFQADASGSGTTPTDDKLRQSGQS